MRPTWAEVDLGAVAHNVGLLVERAAPAEVCAVVKADGYGHGAVPVAQAALQAGASWLAVALVEEAVPLRDSGLDGPDPAPLGGSAPTSSTRSWRSTSARRCTHPPGWRRRPPRVHRCGST